MSMVLSKRKNILMVIVIFKQKTVIGGSLSLQSFLIADDKLLFVLTMYVHYAIMIL